jgi:hypothetical protein
MPCKTEEVLVGAPAKSWRTKSWRTKSWRTKAL